MTNISSNRNFGIVFFLVFLLISIWPIIDGHSLRIWSLIISFTFLFLGLINSKMLSPLNLLWIKLGEILGRIVAPLVMGIIYFIVVTPIGLFMRFIGKDILGKKFLNTQSYWIKREKNIGSMKRQF
tara:strand:+ start:122 stop:499 length:378 start_codon:yes stop_codon:yes gene_type:complete